MTEHTVIRTDNRFAQIPHWVTESEISDGAYRLYAHLLKYADKDTQEAYPARSRLAKDLRKSDRSVDAYIKELKRIHALKVFNRKKRGTNQNYTNIYYVVTANPHAESELAAAAPNVDWEIVEDVAKPVSPPSEAGFAENDTHLTIPTCFTPEQDSEQMLHPHSHERGNEIKKSAGELADPISPAWHTSEDRQIIIRNIQAIATLKAAKDPTGAQNGVNRLHDNLTTAFNSDGDIIDGMIWDYNWEPSKPQTNKLEAAIWLNQLLNAWQNETSIEWRGNA